MEQRVSLVTLGVADLERSRRFYEALGWKRGNRDDGVVFFQMPGGVFALWSRARLAEDAGVKDSGGFGGVALAYNTRSHDEVDAVLAETERAGAVILNPPRRSSGAAIRAISPIQTVTSGRLPGIGVDRCRGRYCQPLRLMPVTKIGQCR